MNMNKGKSMYPDNESTEELREKLKDYYGTAVASGMPMAVLDLARVETMDTDDLEKEAEKRNKNSVFF